MRQIWLKFNTNFKTYNRKTFSVLFHLLPLLSSCYHCNQVEHVLFTNKGKWWCGGATNGKKLGQKGIYIQAGIPEICAKISKTVRADSADAQSSRQLLARYCQEWWRRERRTDFGTSNSTRQIEAKGGIGSLNVLGKIFCPFGAVPQNEM